MAEQSRLKSAFTKSFFYGAGSIFGKVIGVIMLPIYTRYLTPADYGVASLLVFYISIVQLIFGAQLEQGISYFAHNSKHTVENLWFNSVSISTLCVFLPTLIAFLLSEQISVLLFKVPDYSLPLQLVSGTILLQIIETYGFQYLRLKDRFKTYFILHLVKLFIQLGANILFIIFLDMGIVGVALSSLLSTAVTSIFNSISPIVSSVHKKLTPVLIVELAKYCYPLWITGYIGLYISALPQFAISRFSSLEDLGLFNLAYTISALLATLYWAPFFSYWQVERFKIYNDRNSLTIYQSMFKISILASSLLVFGLAVLAKPVISLMSAQPFHGAYVAVFPLTIAVMFRYVTWFFNFSFLIKKATHEHIKNNTFSAIISTGAIAIAVFFSGFEGISWALALSGIATSLYCYFRSKTYYDMGIGLFFVSVCTLILIMSIFSLELLLTGDHSFYYDTIIRVLACSITALFIGIYFFSLYRKSQRLGNNSLETYKS